MNNLLSAISGQFSKSLLLSVMLPVVVFLLLAWVLVVPLIPQSVTWRAWLSGLDTEWQVAALTLVVLLLTALLYNLNGLIIRFYEGYPWQGSLFGRWRAGVHQKEFNKARERWTGLRTLLSRKGARIMPGFEDAKAYWNRLGRDLNSRFPTDEDAVLPTRLGNILRGFEDYPERQYKMESITLWPRLVAQIDERYAGRIDEAKSSLDFMLNSSLLCGLLALLFGMVRLYFPVGLAELSAWFPALLVFLALLGGSLLLYVLSLSRAAAWGELVKGAFDLYRQDLLKALGPWEEPASRDEETGLWEKVSNLIIYSDLTTSPPPDYKPSAPPPTSVTAAQAASPLEVTRGARRGLMGYALTIHLQIRNPDPAQVATKVSVQDRLPDGWLVEWGSAHTAAGPVEVLGTNPYRFPLGDLGAGQSVHLTYRAVQGPVPGGSLERSTS